MPPRSRQGSAGPFEAHDYEFEFAPAGAPKEVNIQARAARPLRVGDHYTVSRADDFCDLIVETIHHLDGGRWQARCRVAGPDWRTEYR